MSRTLPAVVVAVLFSLVTVAQQPITDFGKSTSVIQAGTRTLVDIGSLTDGTYVLTIKAGSLTFEPVLIVVPGPTPTPPPTPTGLREKLSTVIASVVDPKKAEKAGTLAKAAEASVPGLRDGSIPKDSLLSLLGALGPTYPGWSGFFSVLMDAIKAATTGPATADVLQIAAEELGKVK